MCNNCENCTGKCTQRQAEFKQLINNQISVTIDEAVAELKKGHLLINISPLDAEIEAITSVVVNGRLYPISISFNMDGQLLNFSPYDANTPVLYVMNFPEPAPLFEEVMGKAIAGVMADFYDDEVKARLEADHEILSVEA